MANKITELTEDVEVIQKLGDYPNTDDSMSSDELKAQFDKAPAAIKEFLNKTVVPAVKELEDNVAKVDKTLTQEGYFADAKATGESIAKAKDEAVQQMSTAAKNATAAAVAAADDARNASEAAENAIASAQQAKAAAENVSALGQPGEGDRAVTFNDPENRAISGDTFAAGSGSVVGVKGFYWSEIVATDEYIGADGSEGGLLDDNELPEGATRVYKIILSTVNGEFGEKKQFNIRDYWRIGDTISIHNNQKYYDCCEIVSILDNWIGVAGLPFTELLPQTDHFTDNAVYVLAKPDAGLVDFGQRAVAFGEGSRATNYNAAAFGFHNDVYGQYGFAGGRNNRVGHGSAAFGRENSVSGEQSFASGHKNTVSENNGAAHGRENTVSGRYASAFGFKNIASGENSNAVGNTTTASGTNAHAEGNNTQAAGGMSHAEGYYSQASGTGSHAEGSYAGTMSSGNITPTRAAGTASHAEGQGTLASGTGAHSEGVKTTASGGSSHAEGESSKATARACHAEGLETQAGKDDGTGAGAHAEGRGTIANSQAQHVQGKYNVKDTEDKYAHIVGGGSSNTNRKNIHTVDWQGNAMYTGKVYAEGGKELAKVEDVAEKGKPLWLNASPDSSFGKLTVPLDLSTVSFVAVGCDYGTIILQKGQMGVWGFNDATNVYTRTVTVLDTGVQFGECILNGTTASNNIMVPRHIFKWG